MLINSHQQINLFFSRRNQKLLLAFCLGIAIVFLMAFPSWGLDRDIISQTSQNMNYIEAWWDNLWESTFNPPPLEYDPEAIANGEGFEGATNLSIYAFAYPARLVMLIGLFWWIFQYGYKIYESKGMTETSHIFFKMFFPFFLAILLLANYGGNARLLAYAFRDISNSWSEGILDLSMADINLRTALQDQLITEDAKEEIVQRWESCEAMPQPEVALPSPFRPSVSDNAPLPPEAANPPSNGDSAPLPPPPSLSEAQALPITLEQRQAYDYLDCVRELSYYAELEINRADEERACAGLVCRTFKNLYKVVLNVANVTYEQELTKRLDEDVLDSPVAQAELDRVREAQLDPDAAENENINAEMFAISADDLVSSLRNPDKKVFFASQWMYMSTLELAMFLSALFAPIYIAFSMIPGKQDMLGYWFLQSLTIALARFGYFAIIGVFAVQRADPTNLSSVMDQTFFLTLGIFAPAISFTAATVGGIAAAFAYRGAVVGSVGVVVGAFSGAAATIGYSMARNGDKRR
jgi:hypothetical protein